MELLARVDSDPRIMSNNKVVAVPGHDAICAMFNITSAEYWEMHCRCESQEPPEWYKEMKRMMTEHDDATRAVLDQHGYDYETFYMEHAEQTNHNDPPYASAAYVDMIAILDAAGIDTS